jgi:hypothetical protein
MSWLARGDADADADQIAMMAADDAAYGNVGFEKWNRRVESRAI